MESFSASVILVFILYIFQADAIPPSYCYSCTSNQPGCGNVLSEWVQRWVECGEQTMCVKVYQVVNGQEQITRGCLNQLMKNTIYREDMPTNRRHNYCLPGRGSASSAVYPGSQTQDSQRTYCFCDDWNGCNHAGNLAVSKLTLLVPLFLSVACLLRLLH
ncbi:uncharacterized protein LOC106172012 isoform X2 [Lingula anatina]|uniref:Uncharacterized protein LOC106165014 isoform X2 n=1 Tax=Lingula anatina TaxID=7574 RepID=A0A1S3IKX2_LINAN|nr:uncharacterized protein LOC106165014 isoform X2 [Lingula anatina]XP_023932146.1 uncharacterized protein LOC106172012 isoform X2 [Lingula anatina]|eukprot:XP_013398536.1 uncharacterized protein LOC106165014 isoform X2 [Lingula anatina]